MSLLNSPLRCSDHPLNPDPDCMTCFFIPGSVHPDTEMTGTADLPSSVYPEIDDSTLAGSNAYRVHRQTVSSLPASAPTRSGLVSKDLTRRLAAPFDFYHHSFALYAGKDSYSDRFALSDYEEEKPKKARRGRKPKAVKDAKDERIQMLELELERLRGRTPAPEADEPNPPRRGRKPTAKEVEAASDEEPTTIEVELPAEEREEPQTRKSRKSTASQIKAAFAALQPLLPSEPEEEEVHPRPARGRKRKAVEIEEEQPQVIRKSRRIRSKVSYQEDSD